MDKKVALVGILFIILIVTGTFTMTSLGENNKNASEDTIRITDMTGREVVVPKKIDEIVGLGAGSLRLITYLDCTEKVVGVEEIERKEKHQIGRPYILAHSELSELPSIGPMHGGDPELIAAKNPNVIFWTYATAGDAEDLQEKTGIPVIALKYGDLGAHRNTIYEGLDLMGKILDKEERAEEVVQYIKSTIQDLNERTKDIPTEEKPEAYVGGVCYRGSHGIVGTEPKYAPFQFVNAKNPADNLGMEHAIVSEEKIVEWNPDIIFIDEGSYSMAMSDLKESKFRTLSAVKGENIYGVLPQSYYTHNFSTVLADSYYIGKVLYPGIFSDTNPVKKADRIFEELVGKPVYEDMKRDFGGFKKIEFPE